MSDEERERMRGFGYGMLVANAIWCVVLLLTGCVLVRPWAPQPSAPPPPCVGRFVYPDSAGHCIPSDSGKVGR